MLNSDLIQISLRQLYRNRRRYKSVILGIALGIAGLVTILTMGDSVETDLGHNLELLGSATILKATYDTDRKIKWHQGQYHKRDIEALRKLPGVKSVSPAVWSGRTFSSAGKKMTSKLMGVGEDFFDTIYIPVTKGRRLTARDDAARNSVCVVGETVLKNLFDGDTDLSNKEIFISGNVFKVVGLMGGVEDKSLMESVLIPISVARARFSNMYEIKDIYVRAANWDVVSDLHRQIKNILAHNQPGYSESMVVKFYPERIKTIKQAVFIVKVFLYASMGVTLLLGGLGIMNVMLAAVRERTTEIGLRKAVGATEGMIMTQFLVESVSISLMGAVLGMVVGFVSVEVLKGVMKTVPAYEVFMLSLVGGVLFGVLLGMISGFLPAKRASSLDAAEAMRFE